MSDTFMGRRFTGREKALVLALLVILVAGLYFLVVHYPIMERTAEVQRLEEELEPKMAAAEARAAEYNSMKRELEEILSRPEEEISVMPPYNNIETLMRRLDAIFAGTSPEFNFGQARITDNVAERTISFSCTAVSYQAARNLLKSLTGMGYRCLLNSFTLTPEAGDLYAGAVNVSGAVTFYEHVETADTAEEVPAEAPADAAEE